MKSVDLEENCDYYDIRTNTIYTYTGNYRFTRKATYEPLSNTIRDTHTFTITIPAAYIEGNIIPITPLAKALYL